MIWSYPRFKVSVMGALLLLLGIWQVFEYAPNFGNYFTPFETIVVLTLIIFEIFIGSFFIYWGTENTGIWFDLKWGKDSETKVNKT